MQELIMCIGHLEIQMKKRSCCDVDYKKAYESETKLCKFLSLKAEYICAIHEKDEFAEHVSFSLFVKGRYLLLL